VSEVLANGLVPAGSTVGRRRARRPHNTWATLAFAVALLAIAMPWTGFVGIVLAILARRDAERTGLRGKHLAGFAVLVCAGSVILDLAWILGQFVDPARLI
jgi:uncharacterized Tic20 family protein